MAGKKYGVVMAAKVPGSYFALSEDEQAIPGKVMEAMAPAYAGKVELLRRLWTSAFTTEVSDVFYIECDDLMDLHRFQQELTQRLAEKGNPERFGVDVKVWVGVNPDAGA
jgi:hypothetical protein